MPTLSKTSFGVVTGLWGTAMVRRPDGTLHALHLGDLVHAGDLILTAQNGIVQITSPEGQTQVAAAGVQLPEAAPAAAPAAPADDVDRVIADLDSGEPQTAPAAGVAGGGESSSVQGGLRVERISESVSTTTAAAPAGSEALGAPAPVGTGTPASGADTSATPPAAANHAPSAGAASATGAEDTALPIALAGTDADGSIASVTVVQLPSLGTLTLADGTPVAAGQALTPAQAAGLLFHPAADVNGSTSLAFTVTDDQGATSTVAVVQIGITPVNDAPHASGQTVATAYDTPVRIDVLAGAADVDGDALHVAGARLLDPSQGTLTVNPDGSLQFTPREDFHGTASIAYTVQDPSGARSDETIALVNVAAPVATAPAITVDAPALGNDPTPEITGTAALPAGSTVTLTLTDSSGSSHTVQATVGADGHYAAESPALPEGGYVVVATGTDPATGLAGHASDTGSIDLTPPAMTLAIDALGGDDALTTAELAGSVNVTGTAAGEAQAGDTVTLSLNGKTYSGTLDAALHFSIAVPGSELAADADHTLQATLSSTDAAGNTSSAEASRSYEANHAPVVVADLLYVSEDAPGQGNATPGTLGQDRDPDGDAFRVVGVAAGTSPADGHVGSTVAGQWGTLVLQADGSYTYTPSSATQSLVPGQHVSDVFTYTIEDTPGDRASATITVVVNGANDAAAISGVLKGSVTEDATVVTGGQLHVSDADAGQSAFVTQASTAGSHGHFSIDGDGTWSYALDNASAAVQSLASGQQVTDSFTVSSLDGTTRTVVVTVHGSNDAPLLQADAFSTLTDQAVSGNVLANDTDIDAGTSLHVSGFSVAGVAGSFAAGATAAVAGVGTLQLGADGNFTFTPATGYNGSAPQVTYTATDGIASRSSTLDLHVSALPNQAPVGADDSAAVSENATLIVGAGAGVLANDGDPDAGDTLSVSAVNGLAASVGHAVSGTYGTLTLNADGSYSYAANTPAADALAQGQVASESFSYTVRDAAGATSTAHLLITVTGTNDGPVAVNDSATTPINTALAHVVVLANDSDVDGDTLSVTGATVDPALGLASVNADGSIAFTPATGVSGPVAITYTISDGHGGSASATLTVNVGNNTPPTGSDATVTLPEDGSRAFSAADFGFADADAGQSMGAVRIEALPAAGTLTLDGVAVVAGQVIATADLGHLVFTPAADANGIAYASLSFSVQDSAGAFDASPNTISFDVAPQPDAAVIGGQATAAAVEDTAVVASGVLTVVDPDAGEAAFVAQAGVAGAHGSFSIDAAGAWTYTLDDADPAVQALAAGQALPNETFTVHSLDGTAQVITVSISGTNDVPVASADVASTTINTSLASIVVLANDSDVDASDTLSVSSVVVDPALGSASINADGTLRFTPAVNVSGPVTLTYTVDDGHGGTASATVTVNVGSNSAPTGADAKLTLPEDGLHVFSAADFGFNDADPGQSLGAVRIDTLPSAGTLTLDGVAVSAGQVVDASLIGHLVFEPAANANGNAYASLSFSVQDSAGAFDAVPNTLVFDVVPQPDPAVIGGVITGAVKEDALLAAGGQLTVSDPDAGESSFIAQSNVAGAHGMFSVDASGAWSYVLNNADPAVQALGEGQLLPNEVFTVRSADGTAQLVTVSITGTNDVPVAVADSVSVQENAGVLRGVAAGVLANDTDVDTTDTLSVVGVRAGLNVGTVGTVLLGTYGALKLNADGSYAYTANRPAADQLGVGQTGTDTFHYRIADSSGASSSATLTFTVTGTNDAPVAQASGFTVAEDASVVNGAVTAPDADANAVLAYALNGTAPAGLTLHADGTYAFDASVAAYQSLGVGQTAVLTVPYTVTDDQGATSTANLTITVTGTNDGPVANADAASTAINTALSNIVVLGNDHDIDGDTLHVTSASVDPSLGSATVNADGTINFTPASNVTGAVAISYTVDDGHGGTAASTLTVNVGANTAPTGADATITLLEDGSHTFSVADFGFADADAGQTLLAVRIDALPAAGTLTLNGVAVTAGQVIDASQVGQLVFSPAHDANGSGYASLSFSVQDSAGAFDTAPNTIAFDVTAQPDAAIIGGQTAGATVEDTTLVASGSLTVVDPDAGEAAFIAQAGVAGAHGSFSIDASGAWTYALNNADPAVHALGAGQTLPNETFTVHSVDGTAQVITVSITGTNDVPVASASSFTVAEDGAVVNGAVSATDADANAALSFALNNSAPAGLAFHADGTYSFDASNAAYQSLGVGKTAVLTVPYTVTDDQGATSTANLTITVTGTNDGPIANADSASTPINTALSNIVVLGNDSDIDGDTLHVTAATVNPALGSASVNADGTINFTPASNVSGAVAISYTIDDGHGGTATSTLTVNVGANTAPTGTDNTITLLEDGSHAFSAADFGYSDADAGQSFQAVRIDAPPAAGTLTLNGVAVTAGQVIDASQLGQLVFSPAHDANGSGYASISFSVQDSAGAIAATPNTISFDVTAQPDAAIIGGQTSGAAVEDTTTTASGTLTIVDPDAGEAAFVARAGVAGVHGSFSINAAGAWTYTLNNADPAVQALGAGQTLPNETFTVHSVDGTAQVITVSITGTNDVPVASASSFMVAEDGAVVNGAVSATDADANAALSFALNNPAPAGLTFHADGTYSFDASNAAYQSLGVGKTAVLTVPYTVTDDQGATSTANLTITVTGTNDGPIANADSASTPINTALSNIVVLGNDSDIDGDALHVSSATVNPALGTATINADGSINFTPASNVTGAVAISYTVDDGHGGTATSTLTVNVGANTAPTGSDNTITLLEDGSRAFTAADFGYADADAGQSFQAVRIDAPPAAGTLTLNGVAVTAGQVIDASQLGQLVFSPAHDANGSGYASISFSVQDSAGAIAATPNTISFDVTAQPDAAVIGGQTSGATVEDTTTTASGTLTIVDPDAGEAAFIAQAGVAGAHGSFSINAAGAWTYTLNSADPAVQALGAGQTLPNETFTVHSVDGTAQVITVSITGTNDVPVASASSFTVAEDGAVVNGAVSATDADANAALSFALNNSAPAGLAFHADGTYTFDASNAAYQSLGVGKTAVLTVPYTVTDDQGATSTANLTITVTGTNDGPIANADSASTPINTALSNIVVLGNDSDIDGDALHVSSATVNPALGTATINADGSINFTPASNVTGAVAISYTIDDGHGGTATSTLTVNVGANTAPTGTDNTITLLEDGSHAFSAADFGYSDADAGQSFQAVRIDALPAAGTLTLNGVAVTAGQLVDASQLGQLVFSPAHDANGAGYASITFSVQDSAGAFDATPNTISFDVTAQPDAAIIGGQTSGAAVEDTTTTASGTLTIVDPDAGEAAFVAQAGMAGAHGSFSIDASGAWTYTLNNADPAVQALGAGQTLPNETFTVHSVDGTAQVITVSITGTNDVPVASASSFMVAEDGAVVNGAVSATDADANAALSFALNNSAPAGLAFHADGTYTFDASNAAYQSLGVGKTAVLTVPYTVTDDQGATSTANLTITVTGTNDGPIANADSASTPINTALSNIVVLGNDSDIDGDTLHVTSATVNPALGTATINADGSINFTPATNVTGPVAISYTIDDGHGGTATSTLTVNVGANTAPTGSDNTITLLEDGSHTFSAADFGYADADAGQSFQAVRIDALPAAGTLTLNGIAVTAGQVISSGQLAQLVFAPAHDANGAGYASLSFSVQDSAGAFDTAPNTIAFNVTPQPDTAIIGGQTGGATVEDTTTTASGTLTIVDPDAGEAAFVAQAGVAGAHGSFSINAAGAWTYTLNNADPAVQALGAGQTLPNETFTVHSVDGTAQIITVSITGTNDVPVAQAKGFIVAEDAAIVSGSVFATDADANATLSFALNSPAPAGLSFNADGSYSFNPTNSAYQSLGAGQSSVLTIPYTVTDDKGASSTAYLTITVTGTNDGPVAVADTASATEAGGVANATAGVNPSGNVLANDTDVDAGDTRTVSAVNGAAASVGNALAGAHGSLTLNADGSYTYNVNNTDAAVQALRLNSDTITDTFSYTVKDSAGATSTATLTVTIHGANDAPVAVADTQSVSEDVVLGIASNLGVLANDTDVDAGDTKTVTGVAFGATSGNVGSALAGTYGTLTLNADGSYTYSPTTGAAEALAQGQVVTETFSYTMRDAAGATSSSTLKFTVTGVNDAPVAVANSVNLNENATSSANAAAGVLANDTDVDAGDTKTVTAVAFGATGGTVGSALSGTYGTLTLNVDGSYSYSANKPAADALQSGQTGTDTFSYTMKDAAGAASSTTLTFNVAGVNDAPVASADTGSVTAGGTLTVTSANGVVLSGAVPAGKDTDVEGDTLSVSRIVAGAAAPVTAVTAGGVTVSGTYGDLTITSSGSYSYAANKAGAIASGATANDVFTYEVSDGHGGTATTTLTIAVAGQADTITATSSQVALSNTQGLMGEYYGYNDYNPNGNDTMRRHSDDGVYGNLDAVADAVGIINGRNGSVVVGTAAAANTNATDATFLAHQLEYGFSPQVNGSLGTNQNTAAGGGSALNASNSALYAFLSQHSDGSSIVAHTGTADNDNGGKGPTSGLGSTSDALIRMDGETYMAAGQYDIRVTADDGFSLRLDGHTVAEFDGIQSPTTRVYSGVPITSTGLHDLELLYWDQGGNARLMVEIKPTGSADTNYHVVGTDQFALFSQANAPTLSNLQDLVNTGTVASPVYQVRTGGSIDGGLGNDTINGSAGRDLLKGGADNDTINGNAGDDTLYGGSGSDTLTGGAGHDVFRWELADRGTAGNAPRDVITDFDNNNYSGDVLDLRDLLVGETHALTTATLPGSIGTSNTLTITADAGNLGNYLHFSTSAGNTVIEVSSTGGFSGGYSAGAVDQVIQVNGVNLTTGFSTDAQIIQDLLKRGKLVVDPGP